MPTPQSSPHAPQPRRVAVIGGRPGCTIEVAPGQTLAELPADAAQTIALAELVPTGGGNYRQVARLCPRWLTLSRDGLKRLHITISEMTLRRLIAAGFVRGAAVSPWVMQFDYHTYAAHVEAVAADPEFWDRTEPGHNFTNRDRYRQAL